jgi:Uma2 family endonuclease
VSTQPKTFLTPEQYLAIEREAKYKSEYYQGEMFAMAGAGWVHNRLVANLIGGFYRQPQQSPCQACPSDMRVRVSATGLYTYPDVVVVCGDPQFLDERRDTLLNPSLLIEVLSPSTEAYDRGRKSEHYRSIESLREYLLVASDHVHAELFTRQPDGRWLFASANRLEDSLDLQSLGYRLALADLYASIDLPGFQPATAEPGSVPRSD